MKARFFIGSLTLALFIIACEKENNIADIQVSQDTIYTAVIEQPDDNTRSFVNIDGNIGRFQWEQNDKISIIAKQSGAYEIVNKEITSVENGKGNFSLSDKYTPSYAVYPRIIAEQGFDENGSPTKLSLPNTYGSQETPYVTSTNAVMVAKMTSVEPSDVTFKHLAGVLCIMLNNIPIGCDNLVFTTNAGEKISGDFSVDMSAETPNIVLGDSEGDGSSVKFNFQKVVSEKTDMTFYIPLPVGEYAKGFTVTLNNGETGVFSKVSGQSLRIEHKDLVVLPPLYFENSGNGGSDGSPVEIVMDLSEYGTANSYIVSSPGVYKFKATHKGNSSNDTDKLAEIDKVEVLWESFGTSDEINVGDLITVDSDAYSEGYITFTAKDKKGNAVIAARAAVPENAEDGAKGEILWSWHIWLTDQPVDQVYNNNAGTMMDRNLGATSATPEDGMATHGLFYQWGRKDPFLARNYNGDDNTDLMKSAGKEWPLAKNVSMDGTTDQDARENPMQFYTRTNNPYNWLEELDNYRWRAEGTNAKTINDPCPAGYYVPYGGPKEVGFAAIWVQALGIDDDVKLGLDMGEYTDDNAKYNTNNDKGIDFASPDLKYRIMDSGTCWYPACGYLDHGDGGAYEINSYNDWGNYWGCEINWKNETYNFAFGSDGTICLDNHYRRAGGLSVRCQKIN